MYAGRSERWSLDGWWEYAIVPGSLSPEPAGSDGFVLPTTFDGQIRVPFSPETRASGVGRQLMPGELLWYRRLVDLPELGPRQRLVVHFEAVDWRCRCYANGLFVGEHAGGYEPFSFDVTAALGAKGPSSFELILCVEDPSDLGGQPRGKQRREAIDIWYPPQSGIWQGVWMEVVPDAHLQEVSIDARLGGNGSRGLLRAYVRVSRPGRMLRAELWRDGAQVAQASCAAASRDLRIELSVADPLPWSPESPELYELVLRYGDDELSRRCAFRSTTVERDAAGICRFHLNGRPLMLRGVLYQPYWEGSLMTPPSTDALRQDLELARELGFNLVRVHCALMGEGFYELCDELGMLVCQDLVPGAIRVRMKVTESLPSRLPQARALVPDSGVLAPLTQYALGSHDARSQRIWLREACRAIERLRSHPCIVMWTVFNEGWGQFESARVLRVLRSLDPTRPFDADSGWFDQGEGDLESVHDYSPDLALLAGHLKADPRRRSRALMLTECGGLTLRVEGHVPEGASFGYGECASGEELAERIAALRAHLEDLWDAGLAGYVFTQLCDVEQECNGLVTYDRAVRKL